MSTVPMRLRKTSRRTARLSAYHRSNCPGEPRLGEKGLLPVPQADLVHDVDHETNGVDDGSDPDRETEEREDLPGRRDVHEAVQGTTQQQRAEPPGEGHQELFVGEERAVEQARHHRGDAHGGENTPEVLLPVVLEALEAAAGDGESDRQGDEPLSHVAEHDREEQHEDRRDERRGIDGAVERHAVGEHHAFEAARDPPCRSETGTLALPERTSATSSGSNARMAMRPPGDRGESLDGLGEPAPRHPAAHLQHAARGSESLLDRVDRDVE